MNEQERDDLVGYKVKYETAQDWLDFCGVPRWVVDKDHTLTLTGRLNWIRENCPKEWSDLEYAIQKVINEDVDK